MTPLALVVRKTESRIAKRWESLASSLPERTTTLRTQSSVSSGNGLCQFTVAKQLATELAAPAVARFYTQRRHRQQSQAQYAAWFRYYKVVVQDLRSNEESVYDDPKDARLPQAARLLLNAHAMLPKGVRRVVLYSTESLGNDWDPRCI